jgi:hypothetical protein
LQTVGCLSLAKAVCGIGRKKGFLSFAERKPFEEADFLSRLI